MANALRDRLRGMVLWSTAAAAFNALLTVSVSIALARLLLPADFGLVAMLGLFLGTASILSGGSAGAAIVYRRDATDADLNALFWTVLGLALLNALLLNLGATAIAAFYSQVTLEPLVRLASLSLVIRSLAVVPAAVLQRDLRMVASARVGMVGGIVNGAVVITLAARGAGVWSIVVAQLTQHVLDLGLKLYLTRWRPTRPASSPLHRELLQYATTMSGTDLVGILTLNWDSLLVGRWLGPAQLGLYRRARTLPEQVLDVLMQVARTTIFPTLAHVQDDVARVRSLVLRAFALMLGLVTPLLFGLGALASHVVLLLYGPRWAQTGPLLQVMVGGVLLWSIGLPFGMLFQASGRADLRLKLAIVRLVVEAGIYATAAYVGTLEAYAWAFTLSALVMFVLRCVLAGGIVGIGFGTVLPLLVRPALCVGAMLAAVVAIERQLLPGQPPALVLAVAVPCGALVYLGAAFTTRLEGLDSLQALLRRG